ncbi:MAG: winged helix-turn-helix domain-containing protein [Candidatus Helarchaeota archaeon]
MKENKEKFQAVPEINEGEIFKSLSNPKRRDIIRAIGNQKEMTFTEIKNRLKSIDSPTPSYHLKSLQPLLEQKENKYKLSDIGKSVHNLLLKTQLSHDTIKYKKKLQYALLDYSFMLVCSTIYDPIYSLF